MIRLFTGRAACGIALVMVAGMAIAGCKTRADATGTPTAGSSTTALASTLPATRSPFAIPSDWAAPPAAPTGPAPKVAHPLDASRFIAAPCSSLTSAEVTHLGIDDPKGRPTTDPTMAFCSWSDHSSDPQAIPAGALVFWMFGDTGGLSSVYRLQTPEGQGSPSVYWRQTTVEGYPAVYAEPQFPQFGEDNRCALNVGVSDHLYYIAQYLSLVSWPDACAKATQIAMDVLDNVRGSR